jgi:release factor glutamine methyltransferase
MSAAVLASALTIAQVRRTAADRLRARGFDTPDLDARLLVGHALGLDHAALVAQSARRLTPAEAAALDAVLARRLVHEPVARILGTREFWSLPLRVTPDVLVPRPETETVVEAALAVVERDRRLRIADLGVGSGAILLALLSELPMASGIGTDRDPAALGVARDNAQRLGLGDRAGYVACDFGAALAGACDVVVSNPPYIPTSDVAALAADVRDYDPRAALDGGPDGLAAYRAIAADAPRLLAPGGWLAVEIGVGQGEAVSGLLAARGLAIAGAPRRDLAGCPRVVTARKV